MKSLELQVSNLKSEESIRLRDAIAQAIETYFSSLEGKEPLNNLHRRIIEESEGPLLEATLKYTNNNKVHAAKVLGLARGTLRKKLSRHGVGQDELEANYHEMLDSNQVEAPTVKPQLDITNQCWATSSTKHNRITED